MLNLFKNRHVRQGLYTLLTWSPVWIGCTLLVGGAGSYYAYKLKKDRWLASQALIVRDEAASSNLRQGRFESSTHLKAAQELIVDLARNPQVIREALAHVGPSPSEPATENYPTAKDIREFGESAVSIRAPRGSELGSIEILYLDVKDQVPERALQLTTAMTDALERQLRAVREARAASMTEELRQARETAKAQLAESTKRLQVIEKEVGADLPDLRSMVDTNGSFNPRAAVEQLQSELRQAANRHEQLLIEDQLLAAAAADPSAFINAPGNLLNSQPGLKRLREGLVDAQLNVSQLNGKFTENHPSVQAAHVAEIQIRERLNRELQAALVHSRREIESSTALQQRVKDQISNTEQRIDHLANSRAVYANIVNEVRTRSNILENAERQLAEADANRLASQTINLVNRVESPSISDKPIGPGRKTIMAGSIFGGLILGFGLTFLISPLASHSGYARRWSDMHGRRASDSNPIVMTQIPAFGIDRRLGNGTAPTYDGASILRDLLAANPAMVLSTIGTSAHPTTRPQDGSANVAQSATTSANSPASSTSSRPESQSSRAASTESATASGTEGAHENSLNSTRHTETTTSPLHQEATLTSPSGTERRSQARTAPVKPVVTFGVRTAIEGAHETLS